MTVAAIGRGFDTALTARTHVLGLCGHTLGDDTYIKLNVYIEYVFFSTLRVLRDQKNTGQSKYHRNKDVARPKPISKVSGRE